MCTHFGCFIFYRFRYSFGKWIPDSAQWLLQLSTQHQVRKKERKTIVEMHFFWLWQPQFCVSWCCSCDRQSTHLHISPLWDQSSSSSPPPLYSRCAKCLFGANKYLKNAGSVDCQQNNGSDICELQTIKSISSKWVWCVAQFLQSKLCSCSL